MAISLPCCLNVGGALPLQLLLRLAVHIGNLPGALHFAPHRPAIPPHLQQILRWRHS